ncbi:hypothetical protein K7G98_15165 [Saccharothrix sp. MB29]|nr:hypothetical protein [Saccharothrix sp. MB29]
MADTGRPLLSGADFDLFCAGPVTTEVMAVLRRAQYGRRRLALRALLDVARRGGDRDAVERSWRLLADAELSDPASVEDVLMAPAVGSWLARTLREVVRVGGPAAGAGVLHAGAAAAAVRAGVPGRVTVPVAHGVVTLPTVGQCRAPAGADTVELSVGDAGGPVLLDGAEPRFRPFHRHRSEARGLALEVGVDDVDPQRRFSAPAAPAPLDEDEYAHWCAVLDEAWTLLTGWHTGYAAELSAGLTSLVPLAPDSGAVGASSATAFGAVALSTRGSVAEFAETLVHELQHSKLNAVLDLVTLHEEGDDKRHYAPWRDDPRPLTGVLHGLYAFVSVVEFWHGQSPGSFALALRARQLRLALDGLAGLRLTGMGRRLVAAVDRRLGACAPDPAASPFTDLVDRITADHRASWRVRHVRPRPEDVAVLADDWLAGRGPSAPVRGDVTAGTARAGAGRAALLRLRALDPAGFAATRRTGADAAYAHDDFEDAARGYLDRLREEPDNGAAWVGLGLATSAPALLDRPEVVRAVHAEVRARGARTPDPLRLAHWVAG